MQRLCRSTHLIAHKDAPAPPGTLALPCGAAPPVRPPPCLWAARPALDGGRHRGDRALAPHPGLRRPVPSTAAPARPSFHGDRPGWPTGDEPHRGKAVPRVPSANGGRGCSHGCHSNTWSACGHVLMCEPLVWVADSAARASGPALCRVSHHGRSWPWESSGEPLGQVRSVVLGAWRCCSSLGSGGREGHAGWEWACVRRKEGEQGWGRPGGTPLLPPTGRVTWEVLI